MVLRDLQSNAIKLFYYFLIGIDFISLKLSNKKEKKINKFIYKYSYLHTVFDNSFVYRKFTNNHYLRTENKAKRVDSSEELFIGRIENLFNRNNLVLYEFSNNGKKVTLHQETLDKRKNLMKNEFVFDSFHLSKIHYKTVDRIKEAFKPNSRLLSDLERNFNEYGISVFPVLVGSFLKVHPIGSARHQIVDNKDLLAKFSKENNLVISYYEAYEYDKKTKSYIQLIDSLNIKLVFIKKDYFNEWISQENFSDLGISEDGVFHKFKYSGNNPKKNGYGIENILIV